jgi:hypothetical protein
MQPFMQRTWNGGFLIRVGADLTFGWSDTRPSSLLCRLHDQASRRWLYSVTGLSCELLLIGRAVRFDVKRFLTAGILHLHVDGTAMTEWTNEQRM